MRPSSAVVAVLALIVFPAILPAQKVIAFPTLPAPVFASRAGWMAGPLSAATDSIKVGDYRTEGAFFFGFIGAAVAAVLSVRSNSCGAGPVPVNTPLASDVPLSPAAPTTVCEGNISGLHNVLFGTALGAAIGYLIGMGRPKWREGNPDQ